MESFLVECRDGKPNLHKISQKSTPRNEAGGSCRNDSYKKRARMMPVFIRGPGRIPYQHFRKLPALKTGRSPSQKPQCKIIIIISADHKSIASYH